MNDKDLIREAIFRYIRDNNTHRKFLERRWFDRDSKFFKIEEVDANFWLVIYREYSEGYDEWENRTFEVQYIPARDMFTVSELTNLGTYTADELEQVEF